MSMRKMLRMPRLLQLEVDLGVDADREEIGDEEGVDEEAGEVGEPGTMDNGPPQQRMIERYYLRSVIPCGSVTKTDK